MRPRGLGHQHAADPCLARAGGPQDKNPDRVEEATRLFAELQNAYAVLSDPHERAWYDGHREQILREGTGVDRTGCPPRPGRCLTAPLLAEALRCVPRADGDDGSDDEESGVHLMHYFSATAFSGFGDDAKGFYSVYREAFDAVAQAEAAFGGAGGAEDEDDDDDDDEEGGSGGRRRRGGGGGGGGGGATAAPAGERPPSFGTSTSTEEEVRHFYAYWTNFASRQRFAQADQYKLSEAPNRQIRRLMEKENKKLRDAKRREFTETVRVRIPSLDGTVVVDSARTGIHRAQPMGGRAAAAMDAEPGSVCEEARPAAGGLQCPRQGGERGSAGAREGAPRRREAQGLYPLARCRCSWLTFC